jgi:hypothetical protein
MFNIGKENPVKFLLICFLSISLTVIITIVTKKLAFNKLISMIINNKNGKKFCVPF